MVLKSQVTNKVPIFEVSNIDPGVPIKLYLYAENAKGTSDPAIIDDSSQNQQKHYVEGWCFFRKIYALYLSYYAIITWIKGNLTLVDSSIYIFFT